MRYGDFNGRYTMTPGGVPVPEPDLLKWGRWFETRSRIVRVTACPFTGTRVSTVFLGLDHDWNPHPESPDYRPLIFETMVFGSPIVPLHGCQARCRSRQEALEQHEEACVLAFSMCQYAVAVIYTWAVPHINHMVRKFRRALKTIKGALS